jgi:hypothetical protein
LPRDGAGKPGTEEQRGGLIAASAKKKGPRALDPVRLILAGDAGERLVSPQPLNQAFPALTPDTEEATDSRLKRFDVPGV